MMKLAVEFPTSWHEQFARWTDFDFVLAHKVLQDRPYADMLARRPLQRQLMLDNSLHELGYPLLAEQLLTAADLCRADIICAPDKLGDPEFNLEQYSRTMDLCGDRYKIAVTLAGRSHEERRDYLIRVKNADIVCLPFKEPRAEWYGALRATINRHFNRVHLFGVSTREDLEAFYQYSLLDEVRFSVDTTKPVKWGLRQLTMAALQSWRSSEYDAETGGNKTANELLDQTHISQEQFTYIVENIAYLKGLIGDR